MTPAELPHKQETKVSAQTSVLRHSVRGKLVGIILLTTATVLLLSGAAMLVHDLSVYRTSWASDIATEASILALSTGPALAFDDHETAQRNLAALQARPA